MSLHRVVHMHFVTVGLPARPAVAARRGRLQCAAVIGPVRAFSHDDRKLLQ
jgi:hypothetical protein